MKSSGAFVRDATLERYIREISRYNLLTREQEVQLARRYRDNGDMQAAHRLVSSNLRFVVKVVHGYRGYGVKLSDLIQEGNIGLMMAVKKFDPDKGYRLISYAVWWIRSYINNYIIRSWSLVKVGTTQAQRKLFFKLPPAMARAHDANGERRESISRELADQLKIAEHEVHDMEVRMAARDFSLDSKIGDDSQTTHLDHLRFSGPDQEDVVSDHEALTFVRAELEKAMADLNERERYIVKHRLMTEEPKTLGKIGSAFNVSRERVRQIEKKALSKLRATLEQAPLEQALGSI